MTIKQEQQQKNRNSGHFWQFVLFWAILRAPGGYLRGNHPLYLSFVIKYISIWTNSKVLFHFVNNYKENYVKYPKFCFFRWYLNPITHIGVRNTTKLIIAALFWTECRCFGVSLSRKVYHSEEKCPVVSLSY